MSATEGSVAADGVALYYRAAGQGRPLVLIHGTGADSDTWLPVWDRLAEHHRVVAYDRRSHSRSIAPPLNNPARHVADAEALIEALRLEYPVVVGWSAGGIVAMGLAVKRPGLVRALVLEEAVGPWFSTATPTIAAILFRARLSGMLGRQQAGADTFYRWVGRNDELGNALDRMEPAFRAAMQANANSAVAEMAMQPWQAVPQHELRTLPCPVTCLVGEQGPRWFRRVADHICKLAPKASLEAIPHAGHFIHLDAPDAFASAIGEAADR